MLSGLSLVFILSLISVASLGLLFKIDIMGIVTDF